MKDVSIHSSYSGEPIEEIKSIMSSQAQSHEAYGALKEKLKAELGSREPTKEELLEYIKKQNLTSEIVKSVKQEIDKRTIVPPPVSRPIPAPVDTVTTAQAATGAGLVVRVLDGRDFVEYSEPSDEKLLQCSLALFGSRRVTRTVKAALEPLFGDVPFLCTTLR